ncbi:hypothetical protein H0H92_003846 [Tricholoma furcatifolium]|nr:hypothetical protein H0H92_003846 [Tricholoma furcatifolium]
MPTAMEAEPKRPIPVGSNPTNSKDFCNSFWGPGNRGSKTLFGRMELAQKTIKELQKFFDESALRDALEGLRRETEKQAAHHSRLSLWIFTRCEFLVPLLQEKSVELQLGLQGEVEKKLRERGAMERDVIIAREKYEADCAQVFSLIGQTQSIEEEQKHVRFAVLCQARDTAEASQKELTHCTERLQNFLSEWEALWKNFCDRCEDLEEARLDVLKRMIWDNANDFTLAGMSDCESWERIRVSLEQLEPEGDLKAFIDICGTGNDIPDLPMFTLHDLNTPKASNTEEAPVYGPRILAPRQATFNRVSQAVLIPPAPESQPHRQAESVVSPPEYSSGPPKILFYVKARQEYTATTSDHLSFKKGDVIAVTAAGDGIRWRDDLVDQARRQEGRHFFPRTHVSMVQNAAGEPLRPKLFYAKALFDLTASMEGQLSFKKGDIIAVKEAGEAPWWKGEHYDEALREKGREFVSYTCVIPAYNVGTNVDT